MNTILNVSNPDFKPYDIYFTDKFDDLCKKITECIDFKSKICIITDSNVEPLYLNDVISALLLQFDYVTSYTIAAGEESKNLDTVSEVYKHLIKCNFTRKDILIALGGGVVGDLTGFVASTYMRGIDFIQVPTTLLSQVDSSVGGKTGVDFNGYKNMIGAFYQPRAVYINISVLKTLPRNQFISGMGEVVKYGIIKDCSFYNWLKENHAKINSLDADCLIEMIYNCCRIKKEVVENDPKENGERALLNYGHTLGHAIEKQENFKLLHGECVSIGMVLATYISCIRGNINEENFQDVLNTFHLFDMPIKITTQKATDIIAVSKHDKKMENGKIKFILINKIGDAYIDNTVSDEEMQKSINYMLEEIA